MPSDSDYSPQESPSPKKKKKKHRPLFTAQRIRAKGPKWTPRSKKMITDEFFVDGNREAPTLQEIRDFQARCADTNIRQANPKRIKYLCYKISRVLK